MNGQRRDREIEEGAKDKERYRGSPAVQLRGVTRYFPTVPYSFSSSSFNWIHSLKAIRRSDRSPHFPALDHVSLEVEQGEIFGLLGPNGAGKTTMMKILCGSLHPSTGHAYINGHDISREPELTQRRIAVIIGYFQSDMWGSRLTGLENLSFYCRLQGVSKQEAEERSRHALQVVGLAEKMDLRVGTFSAGMYQRLSIARGLVRDAEVWLMDEPTVRLDPIGAEEVRQFIKHRLNREGRAVIYATHYLEEAHSLCDRIAILNRGRIAAQGTPDTLIQKTFGTTQQATLTIQGLGTETTRQIDRAEGVTRIQDLGPTNTGETSGRSILVEWEKTSATSILALHRYIESKGGRVTDLKVTEPDMEDLFLHLTEKQNPTPNTSTSRSTGTSTDTFDRRGG